MKQKAEPIVSVFKYRKGIHRLLSPVYLGILALVIVLVIGGLLINHYLISKPAIVESNVCALPANKHLLETIDPYIQAGIINETEQPYITEIESLKNYQYDPNCLYPLIAYYINISDPTNSALYLSDLKEVYKPTFHYSSALGQTLSLKALQDEVTNLQNYSANVDKNNFVRSPVPASVESDKGK